MPLALYACGLNAHGQLTDECVEELPQDQRQLQCLLRASYEIRVVYAGWADVLLLVDGELLLRGASATAALEPIPCDVPPSELVHGFGDESGLKGVVTTSGELLLLHTSADDAGRQSVSLRRYPVTLLGGSSEPLGHVAIAGNGRVCASFGSTTVEYPSFASLVKGPGDGSIRYSLPSTPFRLLAGETSFAALLPGPAASVYTWGDGRHSHLGRVLTPATPSTRPLLVDHIGGIPIKTLSMGGWITAAVSVYNDLYMWGGRPGEERRIKALPDVGRRPEDDAEVTLVDIDGGADVVDVAVGSGHVVALTADGRLWAVGRNENGQLGIASHESTTFFEGWMPVVLKIHEPSPGKVVSVHAGALNTYVVVRMGG